MLRRTQGAGAAAPRGSGAVKEGYRALFVGKLYELYRVTVCIHIYIYIHFCIVVDGSAQVLRGVSIRDYPKGWHVVPTSGPKTCKEDLLRASAMQIWESITLVSRGGSFCSPCQANIQPGR